MQPETAPIFVFDKSELPREWRRFVAVLCFMLFYIEFVQGGTHLWDAGRHGYRLTARYQHQFWFGAAQVFLAFTMYMCGRSLWYGGRRARWWMMSAVLATISVIALRFCFWSPLPWVNPGNSRSLWKHLLSVSYELERVPWLLTLAVALLWSRHPLPALRKRHRSWVVMASAFVLGYSLTTIHQSNIALELHWWWWLEDHHGTVWLVAALLPLAILVCLLLGSRLARLLCLAVAASEICITMLHVWQGLSKLVAASITAFYISQPRRYGTLPSPFPFGISYLNRDVFRWLFVELVVFVGPWLLIAWYVRRYPMRTPRDDGLPWPREYCGNCGYCLYGIESKICPECGRHLVEP